MYLDRTKSELTIFGMVALYFLQVSIHTIERDIAVQIKMEIGWIMVDVFV